MNIRVNCFIVVLVLVLGINSSLYSQTQVKDAFYKIEEESIMKRLKISNTEFNIIVVYRERHGEIYGKLIMINENIYYSVVEDLETKEKCIIIFEKRDTEIVVNVFGEQVFAGAWITYDGIYKEEVS